MIAFGRRTGLVRSHMGDKEDPFLVVADLLGDIAHWCDRNEVGLQAALRLAAQHYHEETGREGEQFGDFIALTSRPMTKSQGPRAELKHKKKARPATPPTCPDCGKRMLTVSYTIWGTKRFDRRTNEYREDESVGNTDMEFRCPKCSAKLDPERLGF